MSRKRPKAARFNPPAAVQKSPLLVALEKKLDNAERRLVEAYTQADDMVAGWERERDEILNGANAIGGRRGSRKDGDNWPYLRNMEDLIQMRRASREACEGNGYGAGMIDRAVDFVIGDGMQLEITLIGPKAGAVSTGVADADGDGRPDADTRVESVQQVIEEFCRLNDWGCGTEDREEEGFRRSQRDGEVFVRFFAGGADTNGVPVVRWVEPEQVDSPPSAEPNERWGRRYTPGDVESVTDTYIYESGSNDGEWVSNKEIVFHKVGTDRTVLRGMPQFWLVARALYQSDALNSALTEVSAIQAKIAYVREHAPGIMPGQITDFVGGTLDGTGVKRTSYGDRYRRTGIQEEGTTVDMSSGMKFTAGPVSTGVGAFVQALQSRLRQVCARFGYPEFFTGDSSNNNYASSLSAGGPAERAFKRKQQRYAAFQSAVFRRACEYAVRAGRLSEADLNAVEIKVKPGGVSIANKLEEAQVQQIRIQNKVLSVQSAMLENGADPKIEMANIQAFDDQMGGGAIGLGGGFGGGGGEDEFDGGQALPMGEGYTPYQYSLLSEDQKNLLVKKKVVDKNGNTVTRWVKSGGGVGGKADDSVQRAELVKPGAKTAADKPNGDEPKPADKPAANADLKVQGKDLDDSVLDSLKADYSQIPQSEREAVKTAVHDYALGTSYTLINQTLRGIAPDQGGYQKIIDRDVDNLRKAFDSAGKPVPEDTILYRGVGKMPFKFEVGSEFVDKGFVSTTADKDFASGSFVGGYGGGDGSGGTMFEIVVPKGHNVLVPLGSANRKKEVILRDSTTFKVVSIDGNRVRVEVVDKSDKKESYTQDQYDLLSEADRSGLVRKVITNRHGKKQVVWVRAHGDERDAGTHTRQQVVDARALVAKAVADPNSLNPEEFKRLTAHLELVNRDEIRGLLKQVGEKAGGEKVAMANRLVERVRAGYTGGVGSALWRGDTPVPNPRNPLTTVDKPGGGYISTGVPSQPAAATQGDGAMSTTTELKPLVGSEKQVQYAGQYRDKGIAEAEAVLSRTEAQAAKSPEFAAKMANDLADLRVGVEWMKLRGVSAAGWLDTGRHQMGGSMARAIGGYIRNGVQSPEFKVFRAFFNVNEKAAGGSGQSPAPTVANNPTPAGGV